jgi:DNA helicase-2/ATP-dependent DNA helicase PcrA
MDAFERIRQRATRLHRAVVAAGADPQNPSALVDAAIRQLQLELVLVTPGDVALKGARALFDEQSGTVCVEAGGDPIERTLLIAHEIGHAEIHPGSRSCTQDDIDATRSTEVAPVGLQRVEDYGARERRELQANVFAREFVLPREVARHLHLEARLGAQAIASRTGLPLNLVRQQLLDALLLPIAPETSTPEPQQAAPPVPDPSQDRAVAHRDSPFQLQAGPGTGKTRTLVKRISSLLGERVDPSSILVVTFSNRAAGELAERIATTAPEAAPRLWIGTFHAFGLDLVRRYHDRLGLPPNPVLFDRSDAIAVLEEILPTLSLVHYRNLWDPAMVLREIIAAISRAKDELADPARYRRLAQAMLEAASDDVTRVAAEKCLEVAQVYDLYERALRERGAVDFGDLIMRPALLLESDATLRASLNLRHRHVLVDEYQDVNRASGRLLRAVAGDGKRLWVVGDSRQAIYRFRGASSENMSAFADDYPSAEVDQLSVNYRSTQQVVDAFAAFATSMGASRAMLPLKLSADRGNGPGPLEIRRYDTPESEAEGVAASILELERMGIRLRDQAVLCRSNARLNEIAEALEVRGIPVLHLGSLFEREEVRDLLALSSLAVDRFGDGLTRVSAMARYALSLQDVYVATRRLRELGLAPLAGLATIGATAGVSAEGAEAFARLATDLADSKSSDNAWDFLCTYLLDRTDHARDMAHGETVRDLMRGVAVWQFLNFVRERGATTAGPPILRTLDRVRQLVLLAEERDLRQVPVGALHMDAVRLMTVHGSKGLEFEAVHVPGLTVSGFPSANHGQQCPPPNGLIAGANVRSAADDAKQAHDDEEECLFFVALSRARTHLRLYLAQRQRGGSKRSPSPFLDRLPPSLVREISRPGTMALPNGARPQHTAVDWRPPPDWPISDDLLRAYKKCPRRFFYTHVLGLRGGKKPTAFTRTHDCLYQLIEWLAEARRDGEPTLEQAGAAFGEIWEAHGPIEHAFAADYRALALRLVGALVRSGAGRRFRNAEALAIDFPNGRVVVEPDEMAELPNGTVVLRRVRTGRKRNKEYDELEYTLYYLAGQARFGANFHVEALHLTDDSVVERVEISAAKLKNRQETSDGLLRGINGGTFPPEINAVTCPRCPHFFHCAAVPKGPLTIG